MSPVGVSYHPVLDVMSSNLLRRSYAHALAVGIGYGVFVRLRQYAGRPSYWYDEAFLLLNIAHRSAGQLLGAIDYRVVAPPAFLWTLRALYLAAGGSEWVMRLPGLVASLAALALMVPLARAAVRHWLWPCAVVFAVFSYHGVDLSYEVRPYTVDALMTEIVLLATIGTLEPASPAQARFAWHGLLAAALIGPWMSFPSVFVLAGAAAAAALQSAEGDPRWRRRAIVLSMIAGISAAVLWVVSARALYYPGLTREWTERWAPPISKGSSAAWLITCPVSVGDYATTGAGIPFTVLAAIALAHGGRPVAVRVLFGVPILLLIAGSFLRFYPCGDRLGYFAAPLFWLLATLGLRAVAERWPSTSRKWIWSAAALLIVADAARGAGFAAHTKPRVDFRSAFEFVRAHRSAGDRLWTTSPETYEVYYGRDPSFLVGSPEAAVTMRQEDRLWIVSPAIPIARLLESDLGTLNGRRVLTGLAGNLEVALFAPPASARQ